MKEFIVHWRRIKINTKFKLITSFLILCVFLAYLALDAKGPLGKKWTTSQLVSINEIDHSQFNTLLKKYVDRNGYVNYRNLKSSSNDRQLLKSYLSELSKANPQIKATNNARLAFWINAYNAVTLEGILQVYPTTSIRNHTSKLFGYNIWKHLPLIIGSKEYNLEQIEHEILRKMNEPRIHFAIVCASIGCPRLLNEAYSPDKVNQQLTNNTKDFFSRKSNFRIDQKNRTIYLNSILDWFGADFGSSNKAIIEELIPYLPEEAKTAVGITEFRISYLTYNWDLNDQSSLSK